MKNALILHGTDADHTQNWFPWLDEELTKLGYEVWVPDLPQADHPNIVRYNNYLLESNYENADQKTNWDFNEESIIIGHSSGAVEILGLLNDTQFPKDVKIRACFLVGAFKSDLGWESLRGMAGKFDYGAIKKKCPKFVFVHSDNDPYCPIKDARDLCTQLGGKFIEIPGQGHFTVSLDSKFTIFPELLEIIKGEA
jgi:hypothetical protein